MEQHSSLSGLFDVSLGSLDVFKYDLANSVDGLISIDLQEVVLVKLSFTLLSHSLQLLFSFLVYFVILNLSLLLLLDR